MTTTAISIPCALLCLTYLVFSNNPRIRSRVPWEAQSPLQPLLAMYGLVAYSFVGLTLVFSLLRCPAIFEGYKAWLRTSSYWQNPDEYWWFTLSSWCVIGLFLILLLLSPLFIDRAFQADAAEKPVTSDATDELERSHERKHKLRRLVDGILNFL
jgi:hypothetical protein